MHGTINHKRNFVYPITGAHSQMSNHIGTCRNCGLKGKKALLGIYLRFIYLNRRGGIIIVGIIGQ